MTFKERNIELTIKALEGSSLASVGKKYNLTPERIRQIVFKTCHRHLLASKGIWRNKAMDGIHDLKTMRNFWKDGTLQYPST